MNYGNVEDGVRSRLIDTQQGADGSYRYAPALVLSNVADGVRQIHSLHPETRYDGLVLVRDEEIPAINETSGSDVVASVRQSVIRLDEKYKSALVFFACSRVLSIDSSDQNNAAMSLSYMQDFERIIA